MAASSVAESRNMFALLLLPIHTPIKVFARAHNEGSDIEKQPSATKIQKANARKKEINPLGRKEKTYRGIDETCGSTKKYRIGRIA